VYSISNCPHCGQRLHIPEEMFGWQVRCSLCGQVFTAGTNQTSQTSYPETSYVRNYVQPHRGGLILTLGILGLVVCGPLGIFAWIMGANDLAKMRRGYMDRSGYGSTQAGYILGIISTIFTLLTWLILAILLIAGIMPIK